jgi:O-methyltransferase
VVDELDGIIRECSPFSMIQGERFAENIHFLMDLRRRQATPHGDIVECGVWKGGMALALTRIFGTDRSYGFFDSFEGLPPPNSNDGQDAHFWTSHPEHPRYFENCRAEVKEFKNLLQSLRPKHHDINVVKGWFSDSLVSGLPDEVAFAHVDCDWYDSVYLCLEHLWPRMTAGGIILIDDYYDWEGCRRAVHDFLSRHKAREAIRSVGNFGGVSITRLGDWAVTESPHLQ